MQRCALCQVHTKNSLCEGCQTLVQVPENPCQICAKPLLQTDHVCGECRNDEPAFSQTICAAIYQPPVSVWVQQLKFGGRLDRARIMAEALCNHLNGIEPSVPILPVPLHKKRLLSRGYNQAYEVAKIMAANQGRRILDRHLIRTKHTAMQAELHEKQRSANVRAAFKVNQPIDAPVVMVLDDVMTTGQTMRSVASCLKRAGVEEVIAVVFARSAGI